MFNDAEVKGRDWIFEKKAPSADAEYDPLTITN
jgi:hypothetical protein